MLQPSILFINRVFPPDRGATGRCLADLAGRFALAGWKVTVLACGGSGAAATGPVGVEIVRTGPIGQGSPGVAGYLVALGRLLTTALRLPRPDLVVTMTDPPLLAVLGPLLRRRWGCGLIHWSHDLYPDLLKVLGMGLSGSLPGPAVRLLQRVSRAALGRHDAVVVIGTCMAKRLAGLGRTGGIPAEKIVVIPNWADPVIRPVEREANPMRAELELGDRFTVAYSGNFGLVHPMAGLLDAAAALARRDPEIVVLLIGEGRGLERVRRGIAERALPNLRLLPWQPADRLAESLGAADLHIATMATAAEGMLVPSKVAGALAAGRPCILLGPEGSAAARTLVEGRCGSVLEPGNDAGLVQAILDYAHDREYHAAACARARTAAIGWTADHAAAAFLALALAIRVGRPLPVLASAIADGAD